MSYRIHVVAPPGIAAGFRLAGLAVGEASTPREAEDLLRTEAACPDAGVILVQQALYDALPLVMRRELERRPLPIVVPVPAAQWAEARRRPEDYILELLQRAVGYRVRLQ
jgi:vacuolar-type H+-ATPase subunit F/Vma7